MRNRLHLHLRLGRLKNFLETGYRLVDGTIFLINLSTELRPRGILIMQCKFCPLNRYSNALNIGTTLFVLHHLSRLSESDLSPRFSDQNLL